MVCHRLVGIYNDHIYKKHVGGIDMKREILMFIAGVAIHIFAISVAPFFMVPLFRMLGIILNLPLELGVLCKLERRVRR